MSHDIYFGEYMRIFDHHYARYIVKKIEEEGTGDADAGFLRPQAEDWLRGQYNRRSYKDKRRRYSLES